MISKILLLLLSGFSSCVSQTVVNQQVAADQPIQVSDAKAKPNVLVELFTSEGCSSCPPADRALAFLQKEQPNSQAEIITLGFHVDYWNNLGWKDEFSSDLFTQRQQFYARKFSLNSVYTPQMVIDGKFEAVGSNLGKIQQAISTAASEVKAKIDVTNQNHVLRIDISQIPIREDATVYLAIAENNLTSNVKRGENAGNQLGHISVVRELKMLGKIEESSEKFSLDYQYQIDSNWKMQNVKLVIFIQENISRKILGIKSMTARSNGGIE
jgi:hypothetical protein